MGGAMLKAMTVGGVFAVAALLCTAWVSVPAKAAEPGFAQRYHAYQALSRAGYESLQKKDYAAAIDQYTQAIDLSPFVPSDHYYRGLAWFKSGNDEKAIADFNKVLLLDARWAPAYLYRGLAHLNRGEETAALSDDTAALNLNGKDPTVHNNLAWLYATAKDDKIRDKAKALEYARQAAVLSKEGNAQILDTLATAYFINGKVQEALDAERKAVQRDPRDQGFAAHLTEYQKAFEENQTRLTTNSGFASEHDVN
jgi:tetratricopeptide (TPR) repeat protein